MPSSLLIEDAEDATSDHAECGSAFITPISSHDSSGKVANKKVRIFFKHDNHSLAILEISFLYKVFKLISTGIGANCCSKSKR